MLSGIQLGLPFTIYQGILVLLREHCSTASLPGLLRTLGIAGKEGLG